MSDHIEHALITAHGCDDEAVIRRIVTEAIKASDKSRQQIADQMTILTGQPVTQRALDSYTSESAKQNRFPAQYIRAFCQATGNWKLLDAVTNGTGFHVIRDEESQILDYGRLILRHDQTTAARRAMKARLAGVTL